MNILLLCCAAFFVVLLLLWMDEEDVGANAVVVHVLPMATAVARAAVVDRENFMVWFVQLAAQYSVC